MLKKYLPLLLLALTACQEPAPTDKTLTVNQETTSQTDTAHFNGCYAVEKNTPAQIKISTNDGQFVMQMKEPSSSASAWDKPEPLDVMSVERAWEYFGVNALSLNKSDVESVLARPDEMMILAKIKPATQNINPLIDSPYVVYIFKGANTIYQVACDDTPVDIIKDGHTAIKKAYH